MDRKSPIRSARWELRGVAVVLAACLLAAPLALAEPGQQLGPNYDAQGRVEPAVDAIFLRPLGLVATIVGTVIFVAYAPIIAITRPTDIAEPFKSLVIGPARYTWVDPLGYHPEPLL